MVAGNRVKLLKVLIVFLIYIIISSQLISNTKEFENPQIPEFPKEYERQLIEIDSAYNMEEKFERSRMIINQFLPIFPDARQKAVVLNKMGYAYYKKGDYQIACLLFAYSAYTDNTYKYPFYNYVCSTALKFSTDESIAFNADEDRIMVEYLKQAIELDNNYREKMRIDPDLEVYQKEAWFIILSGADPTTYDGIKDILMNTEKWYGPKPGVYPQSPELIFDDDGTLSVREFHYDDETQSTGWTTSRGEYQIYDGYILINYNGNIYRGVLEDQRLFIEDFCFYPYFTTTVDTGL
ncbi:MAG: hypothetical protein ACLFPF_01520 [Halanaerobiales bacterium]